VLTDPLEDLSKAKLAALHGAADELVSCLRLDFDVEPAGESWMYGGCGQEYREGTARFIRRKAGVAEATVGVQGPYNPDSSTAFPPDYPTEGPNCVWTDFLHWKAGAGFRVRQVGEDCKAPHENIKISEDGSLTVPAK
jgi:hypothetical protein